MITATSPEGKEYKVNWTDNSSGQVNDQDFEWDLITSEDGGTHIIFNHKSYNLEVVSVDRIEKRVQVMVNGKPFEFQLKDRFDDLLEELGMDLQSGQGESQVKAPMPGLVLNVLVENGQSVSKGDPLLILEAMKMENVIKATSDATVAEVKVSTGKAVEKNEVLIEFAS